MNFIKTPALVALALSAATACLAPAQAAVLADSVKDFTLASQGVNHWYYGWAAGTPASYTVSAFKRMTHVDTIKWYEDPTTSWLMIWAEGQHPQGLTTTAPKTPTQAVAVRRWIAPTAGTYKVTGTVTHVGNGPGSVNSDGVEARIVKGTLTVWSASIAQHGTQDYAITVKLQANQPLDFVLGPGAASNDIEDATSFSAVISQ